jgi:uncharacterized membrane protein YqjE
MSAEAPDKEASHGGLLGSVKNLAATLITIGQTRLELLSNDIEEERAWLTTMLVWILAGLFFSALAVVLATLLIVIIFWDSYRLQAISFMIVLFVLGAFIAWRAVCNISRKKPRLFSASLAELSIDREQLSAHPHE